MNKKEVKFVVLLVLLVLLLILTSCASIPVEKQCETVDQCSPEECCHSSEAVNKKFAPDCTEVMCTMECVPRTLDCDQGDLVCVRGECEVVIRKL